MIADTFLAPALTWKPDGHHDSFLSRVSACKTTQTMAFRRLGDRPAPVPISNYYGEPWQCSAFQSRVGSVDVSHNLGQRWVVRSRFRATLANWDDLDASQEVLEPDNRTSARYYEDAHYPLRFYDWQTDLTGIFKTGKIEHNVPDWIRIRHAVRSCKMRFSAMPRPLICITQFYFSLTVQIPQRSMNNFFNPSSPDYFPIDGTTKLMTHGGYIQDQITLLPG